MKRLALLLSSTLWFLSIHTMEPSNYNQEIWLTYPSLAEVNSKEQTYVFSPPLILAAQNGHTCVMKILIEAGADVNAPDYEGMTPLHQAAQHGHVRAVELLIEKNADINARDTHSWTPLHKACLYGHAAVIKALLKGKLTVKPIQCFHVESLRTLCVYKLLNNRVFDDESIFGIVIPLLDQLKISFEKRTLNINLYKKILYAAVSSLHDEFIKNDIQNAIQEKITRFGEQYLQFLKKKVDDEILRTFIQHHHNLRELFEIIAAANTFDDLPEDMKDIIYDPEILQNLKT